MSIINIIIYYRSHSDVYAWGDNRFGQCGTGSTTLYYSIPERISFFKNKSNIVSVEAGDYTSSAIINNKAYVWGAWFYGESGHEAKYIIIYY